VEHLRRRDVCIGLGRQATRVGARQKGELRMKGVRVLAGTRKGAFILTSDEKRQKWDVSGPHFAGWEIYHLKGSPADPDRIYASQTSGWFGQVIQRSDDGGKTWHQPGTPKGEPTTAPDGSPKGESNKFVYDTSPETGAPLTTHQYYDGTQKPWVFKRVWHLEPSLSDPNTVYAGIEDAAIFRTTDGGKNWKELSGLRGHGTGPKWQPGAGGMCLHTILLDPRNDKRIFVAISSAGAFRSDDGGQTWKVITKGLHSQYIPDPTAEVGHCVHRIAQHRSRPNVLFMQKHWDVLRSDDAGDNWTEVSGNLPTDFGFVIDVHTHEPETVYVVPIKSDSEHYPPDGKLRVYRSRKGGNEWEALTDGLPQKDCYVNVLRDAMAIDSLDSCGVYFGTTGGQVYCSPDGGDHWAPIVRDLPPVLSVEVQTLK
jgi:BNR/Asp-box repeat